MESWEDGSKGGKKEQYAGHSAREQLAEPAPFSYTMLQVPAWPSTATWASLVKEERKD